MKYKQWLNVWLENYVRPDSKMRTTQSYERIINKYITVALGEKELADINTADIQTFVTRLLTDGKNKNGRGIAASSVNTVITVIHSSLNTAITLGYLTENVAKSVKRPRIRCKEVTCFTPAEQRKIEQAALADPRGKMFGVILSLYTGLRIGELLALTWSDLNLEKGLLSVTKACYDGKTENGYDRITDEPKTQSSKRIIPLPKQLLPYLKRLKKSQKSEYIATSGGNPVTVRSYQRSFALFLKKHKIPHRCFHTLRHTFATRALECGMDVKTLSEILGHKSATITLNRYAHSLLEHKTEMMNRLGKALTPPYGK